MQSKKKIHIISHSHWDREWYMPYEKFRMRLLKLVNELIDTFDQEENYRHFNLDGQTICVEDYLDVFPENREILKKLVEQKKIAIGPWYVLPDEFLEGAEPIIRNLMLGRKIARSMGGCMQVGYLPDTFSHISQMPQILKKSGYQNAVVWRGISGEPDKLAAEFLWQAPDGSQVVAAHLSDDFGYFGANEIPDDPQQAAAFLRERIGERLQYASGNNAFLLNGFDHKFPDRKTGDKVKRLNEDIGEYEIVHSSLEQFFQDLRRDESSRLQIVEGELTKTNYSIYGSVNLTIRNVLSSRMYLKLKDFMCEKKLASYAEPLMTLNHLEGGLYEKNLLDRAWKYFITNHAHDSICGCSTDETHKDMEMRYLWTDEIVSQCIHEAMYAIGKKIDTSNAQEGAIPVHIFNSTLFSREQEIARVTLFLPQDTKFRSFQVTDETGAPVDYTLLDIQEEGAVLDTWERYPDWRWFKKVTLALAVDSIDGLGYRTLYVKPKLKNPNPIRSLTNRKNCTHMENEYLSVDIWLDGSIDLLDKESGAYFHELNSFVDDGDIGDEYEYSPPYVDRKMFSQGGKASVSLLQDDALQTVYRIAIQLPTPECCTEKGEKRSEHCVDTTIETDVTLKRGSRVLEFSTKVTNRARDHRLRVIFPTGLHATESWADNQFDIVHRPLELPQPCEEAWLECATNQYAQKRFCGVEDGETAFAVLNRGIPEYEVVDKDGCQILLTLLRCVDKIGSENAVTTAMAPGPSVLRAPGAQCIGTYTFAYAVMAGSKEQIMSTVCDQAERFICPLSTLEGEIHTGTLPQRNGLMSLEGDGVQVSALKLAEDRNGYILRVYNPWERPVEAKLSCARAIQELTETNLLEDQQHRIEIKPDTSVVIVSIEPKEIKTYRLVL